MGLIGAAFGLGFVIGPALAYVLWPIHERMPAYFAAGLSLCACAFGYLRLKEPPRNLDPSVRRIVDRHALAVVFRDPPRVRLLLAFVLVVLSFSVLESMFTSLGKLRLGLEMKDMGGLLALVGILMALVQGGLIRRLAPKYGEVKLVAVGGGILAAGMAHLALAPGLFGLVLSGLFAGIGYSVLFPALQARLSKASPATEQGATFGVAQSGSSLCRFVGHFGAGWTFDVWSGLPFVIASIVALLAAILGSGRAPEEPSTRAAEAA